MPGDAPKVDGTATVPTLFGDTLGEGVGLGVGVDVETSIGVGDGESVGEGLCPNATSAARNAVKVNAVAREFFRVTKSSVGCWMRQV
jgi:hypothetical protein